MKAKWISAALALVVLTFLVFIGSDWAFRSKPHARPTESTAEVANPSSTFDGRALEANEPHRTEASSSVRIRCVDSEEKPVADASIQLLFLSFKPHRSYVLESDTPPDSIPDPAWVGNTDASGIAIVPRSLLEGVDGAVLVAIRPGYRVDTRTIESADYGNEVKLVLISKPLDVRVVSGVGAAVAGAEVSLRGMALARRRDEVAAFPISMDYLSDQFGNAPVPFLEHAELTARSIGSISCSEVVDDRSTIVLWVRPEFRIRIRTTEGTDTPLAYTAWAQMGVNTPPIAHGFFMGENGGTQSIPYLGPLRYTIALSKADRLYLPTEIARPEPGRTYDIAVKAAGERHVALIVQDAGGVVVPRARVRCTWTDASGDFQCVEKVTDSTGLANFQGLPDALVSFWAWKKGFVPTAPVDAWTPFAESTPSILTLNPSARIYGRVTRAGIPVVDFSIWYSRDSGPWDSASFLGAVDGEFMLDGIAPGRIDLLVTSTGYGQSDIYNLTATTSGEGRVLVEMADGLLGRCVAVDALTGNWLEDAEAQVLVSASGAGIGVDGPVFLANSAGEILVSGLRAGTARIRVSAPGHTPEVISAFVSLQEAGNFGLVRLSGSVGLQVTLHPDGPLRLDWCSATVVGGVRSPRLLFSSSGLIEFPSVAIGANRLEITRADIVEDVLTLDISNTPSHHIHVPICVSGSMAVVLAPEVASQADGVEFFWHDHDGRSRSTFKPSAGQSEFSVPVDARLVEEVQVAGIDSKRILRRVVTAQERADARIEIGETDELVFRVVDRNRAPVSGASVLIRRPDGDPASVIDSLTDRTGTAFVRGVDWNDLDVLIFQPDLGVARSARLPAERCRPGPYELELNPIGRTRVAVRDGEVAIAGVQVRFLDPKYNAGRAMTDEEGVAWSLPLQEGKYRAEVGQSGYWPAVIDFECNKEEVWTTLQVRRTGGLDLELQSASARDVRSYVLELRSKEFETSVSGWLDAGKVVSPQGGRPDKDGRLELYGLPNGEYTWTAILDGAGVMAGEIEVGPHSVNKKKLFLP